MDERQKDQLRRMFQLIYGKGYSKSKALAAIGLGRSTYYDWHKAEPEIVDAIEAEARDEVVSARAELEARRQEVEDKITQALLERMPDYLDMLDTDIRSPNLSAFTRDKLINTVITIAQSGLFVPRASQPVSSPPAGPALPASSSAPALPLPMRTPDGRPLTEIEGRAADGSSVTVSWRTAEQNGVEVVEPGK